MRGMIWLEGRYGPSIGSREGKGAHEQGGPGFLREDGRLSSSSRSQLQCGGRSFGGFGVFGWMWERSLGTRWGRRKEREDVLGTCKL